MKTIRLLRARLSPWFSSRFPCTACGKPVLPYRGLQLPRLVIAPTKAYQTVCTTTRRELIYFAFYSLLSSGNICPGPACGTVHQNPHLFGIPKYALIRRSRVSSLAYGNTGRTCRHPGHHYTDSRDLRLCSRSKSCGTVAQRLPAHSGRSPGCPRTAAS